MTFHEASVKNRKKSFMHFNAQTMIQRFALKLILFLPFHEASWSSKKNWSKENLCVRPYSCSEWSRTFECQWLSCLESCLKFPLLFVLKNIRKWFRFVNGSGHFLSVPTVIIISDFFPFLTQKLELQVMSFSPEYMIWRKFLELKFPDHLDHFRTCRIQLLDYTESFRTYRMH